MPYKSAQKEDPKLIYGFTLIELLISIAIVAILSTIGIALYTQTQVAARDSKRQQEIRAIRTALEQYYTSNANSYPADLSETGVAAALRFPTVMNSTNYFVSGTVPSDATGNYTYKRCQIAGVQKFLLCTTLENQKNGNRNDGSVDGCQLADEPVALGTNEPFYCVNALQGG